MKTIITIKGTHCTSCKELIEDVCRDISGVIKCSVNFKTGKTEIEHSVKFDINKLEKEIESLGLYKVEI